MPDPFHVLLLRHGQTDANAGGVLQGWRPVPLNAAGIVQSTRLASRLKAFEPRVRRVISSDLVRARQTAEPIAAGLDLPIEFDGRWRERGLGELEGQTIGERETWRAAAGEIDPAGAEPVPAFQARAADALLSLLPSLDDTAGWAVASPVAVVTHGGTIRSLLRLFADGRLLLVDGGAARDATDPGIQTIANCSILHLTVERIGGNGSPAWRIECVNDVAHLEDGEITARDSG